MNVIFVLCGMITVLAFTAAGLAKLSNPRQTATMLVDFGIVKRSSRAAALCLPILELLVALAILMPSAMWLGVCAALLVLGGFTLTVAAAVVQGRHPLCNCFGQAAASPVGWGTVARNLVLMAIAGSLLASPERLQHGLLSETANLLRQGNAMLVLLALLGLGLAAVQAWVNLNVIRQQGRLLLKIDTLEYRLEVADIGAADTPQSRPGLAPGTPAPDFLAETLGGTPVQLSALLTARKMVLVFVNADCKPCTALMPDLERAGAAAGVDIQLITSGSRQSNIDKLGATRFVDGAIVQNAFELSGLFGVVATPSAVCIAEDGTIASSLAVGHDAILDLVRQAATAPPDFTEQRLVRPVPALAA
jgi:hypothetical protein